MKILYLLIFSSIVLSQPQGRQVMELAKEQIHPKDLVSTISMTLIKNLHGKEKSRVRTFSNSQKFYETGEFLTKTLIRFQSPEDLKGTGLLIWEYRDTNKESEQWLYLPAIKRSKKIFSREKIRSFMGSDFSYEDIKPRDIDEDTYEILGQENIDGKKYYKIKATPIKISIYSKRIIWVDKDESLISKIEFYDKDNQIKKIMTIPKVKRHGDYLTILKMEMENIEKSQLTTIELLDISYDNELEESFFSKESLIEER